MLQDSGISTYALDIFAVCWLMFCWVGYAVYARRRAKTKICIASVIHSYRQRWMLLLLQRENRITDASLLANLERNASFLASSTLFVIAGLVTALASMEKVYGMLSTLPFSRAEFSPLQLQFKIMLLLMIYVYSFFTFTWAMRQYGFCAMLLGAAPLPDTPQASGAEGEKFARYAAKVIDQAGHSYNYGLRGYYFSLAVLGWLINAWLFAIAVAMVVAVLYAREFHSVTLKSLVGVGIMPNFDKH